MKKVDLTTLDICSVIVNRVESMPQSTDYLVFGTYSPIPPALAEVWRYACRVSVSIHSLLHNWYAPRTFCRFLSVGAVN